MKSIIVIALSLLFAAFGAVSTSNSQDVFYGGFEGTWEGTVRAKQIDLKSFDTTGTPTDVNCRIAVSGTNVHVFVFNKTKNEWAEVKANAFRIVSHKTSAIVYSIDSAADVMDKTGSGGWVETWNFTITHKDKDTLYVDWVRGVNNYLSPPDKDGARFFFAGFGEMTRVK